MAWNISFFVLLKKRFVLVEESASLDNADGGSSSVVDKDQEKAARRTLRAIKQKQTGSDEQSQAALAPGTFTGTIKHFSRFVDGKILFRVIFFFFCSKSFYLCHKPGEKKLGAVKEVDSSCLFIFEPFKVFWVCLGNWAFR